MQNIRAERCALSYRCNRNQAKGTIMKKLVAAAAVLMFSASAAYAAAPESVHALAKACGLPCC
jgi:hypothetical protein